MSKEGINNEMKNWNNIKTNDSWAVFKIMSEFVEGFERLARIGPCVSIFGSARTNPENKYYKMAEELAYQLTKNKYGVITSLTTSKVSRFANGWTRKRHRKIREGMKVSAIKEEED